MSFFDPIADIIDDAERDIRDSPYWQWRRGRT